MNSAIRSLFPAAQLYTYLNSAAVSPIPTTAIEAINWQLADVASNGTLHFNDWVDTKNRARLLVSEMLNVRSEQVAFLRNTSDGFASIANGLTWSADDNIVSFEPDQRGVTTRNCSQDANREIRSRRTDPTTPG